MTSGHAVVVGGSFAGITAARVLTEHFERVTIVEPDTRPEETVPRRGVPQGSHVHGILQLGRTVLERLFPGFVADTEREGAFLFDLVARGSGFGVNGWGARGPSAMRGYAVRRPLLERVAWRRLCALPAVEVVSARVSGLVADGGGRVRGVEVHEGRGPGAARRIEADLVVDASGRGSSAPSWLEQLGRTPPAETVVNGRGGYASRLVRVPDDAWPGDMISMSSLPHPGNTKGAILYPQDNGLHIISLFGQSGDHPPAGEDEFAAFLKQISTPLVHDIVARSEPVTRIRTTRSTGNRWRHYERPEVLPAGFVLVGDAAACFNPMAGQGITSACVAAEVLGEVFTEVDGDPVRLPAEFAPRLAARLQFPWRVALGFDLAFPGTIGERPVPTAEQTERAAFTAGLAELSTVDPSAFEAMLLANNTFDASVLADPVLAEKVAQWRASGRRPPNLDPMHPPAAVATAR